MSSVFIDLAANGHLWVRTESLNEANRIGWLLMFRYFFVRWGFYRSAITDEAVYPDYIRGRLRIEAGWDNWSGYDFLSVNSDTDNFLERFIEKHLPDATRRAIE